MNIREIFTELGVEPSDGWRRLEGWTLPDSAGPLSPAGESLIRSILEPGQGITITRDRLEEWVGHRLTAEQVEAIGDCVPHSSIPQAIATIALEALGIVDPEDES